MLCKHGAHSWMCLQVSAKRDAKVSYQAYLNFALHICQLAQRHPKDFPQRLFVSCLGHICCCFSILIAGAAGESRPLENGSDSRVCLHPVETSHASTTKKSLFFGGGIWFDSLCDVFLQVPMMHGATPVTVSAATTSATSVPFATATANQVCLPPASPLLTLFILYSKYLFASGINLDLFFWHLMILMCFIKPAWGLIPDLCQLLTASVYSGNYYAAVCPQLDRSVCLSFFNFCPFHWLLVLLSPPPFHTDSSYICRPPD